MRSLFAGTFAAAALLTLAACQSPEPPKTAEAAPAVTVTQATIYAAPKPPPPAQVEFIPPRPDNAPSAVWQPGHWRWGGANGAEWQWVAGTYVVAPPGYHAWVPGRWQLQSNGWIWSEGHWA